MAETTYVKMHDRQVPVELDLFTKTVAEKDCFASMRLQQGVINYAIGMHAIWPTDYSPLVIMKVLAENRWGEAVAEDEKTRTDLVKKFFNEVIRENSGRAVRGEPPLDYEQCRAKWSRTLELSFPKLMEADGGKGAKSSARDSSSSKARDRAAGSSRGRRVARGQQEEKVV